MDAKKGAFPTLSKKILITTFVSTKPNQYLFHYTMRPLHKCPLALVDSRVLFCECLSKMINEFEDYIVTIQTTNVKHLIGQLMIANPMPEICLIDIDLAKVDDFKVVKEIKKKWRFIKVIFLSTHDEEQINHDKYSAIGANDCLHKRCTSTELFESINVVRNSNNYLNRRKGLTPMMHLTQKEMELVKLVYSNLTYKEIAEKMLISKRTVETHRDHLFEKFNVNSRSALIKCAIELGLLSQ
jgi:two-component system response regulator NreC